MPDFCTAVVHLAIGDEDDLKSGVYAADMGRMGGSATRIGAQPAGRSLSQRKIDSCASTAPAGFRATVTPRSEVCVIASVRGAADHCELETHLRNAGVCTCTLRSRQLVTASARLRLGLAEVLATSLSAGSTTSLVLSVGRTLPVVAGTPSGPTQPPSATTTMAVNTALRCMAPPHVVRQTTQELYLLSTTVWSRRVPASPHPGSFHGPDQLARSVVAGGIAKLAMLLRRHELRVARACAPLLAPASAWESHVPWYGFRRRKRGTTSPAAAGTSITLPDAYGLRTWPHSPDTVVRDPGVCDQPRYRTPCRDGSRRPRSHPPSYRTPMIGDMRGSDHD